VCGYAGPNAIAHATTDTSPGDCHPNRCANTRTHTWADTRADALADGLADARAIRGTDTSAVSCTDTELLGWHVSHRKRVCVLRPGQIFLGH
jgi:hypothetical protein